MHFTKLVPSVFYKDLSDGLKLFVDCLHFNIHHQELHISNPYCVLEKTGSASWFFRMNSWRANITPELRLVTDNIDEVYVSVSASHPHLLHPNLNKVTVRPRPAYRRQARWPGIMGAKEFALADNPVGIRFQQW